MRGKKLLAVFVLGVGLCFVPALGYGEVKKWMNEAKASYMDFRLLNARVSYMMHNPTTFLNVNFLYDPVGRYRRIEKLPESIDTKGKILIVISDTRDVFSYKSGIALLDQFKRELEVEYTFVGFLATDMDTDIVAIFANKEIIPLGYFYQGEYHLWETNRAKGTTKEEVTPPVPFLFENVTVWEISRVRSGAVLGTRLKGEVINQSGVTYNSHVWFRVTLYDRAGEVLGWREFTTFDLKDGQRKPFEVPFYGVNPGDVWNWKIEFDRGS